MTTCSHLTVLCLRSSCLCLFPQSRQKAEGLGCDVVRVEVDESLTKEQLLETFIHCGRCTNAHVTRLTHVGVQPHSISLCARAQFY